MRKIQEGGWILAIAFHPTLQQIIFGGSDMKLKLKCLDLNGEETMPEEIGATNKEIMCVSWNKDCMVKPRSRSVKTMRESQRHSRSSSMTMFKAERELDRRSKPLKCMNKNSTN